MLSCIDTSRPLLPLAGVDNAAAVAGKTPAATARRRVDLCTRMPLATVAAASCRWGDYHATGRSSPNDQAGDAVARAPSRQKEGSGEGARKTHAARRRGTWWPSTPRGSGGRARDWRPGGRDRHQDRAGGWGWGSGGEQGRPSPASYLTATDGRHLSSRRPPRRLFYPPSRPRYANAPLPSPLNPADGVCAQLGEGVAEVSTLPRR